MGRIQKENKYKTPETALVEIVRGRLEALGPIKASQLTRELGLDAAKLDQALIALENDGFVFRGQFTTDESELEWCERRLLSRIHRYTIQKLRKEISAVSPAVFMDFLFSWHHLSPHNQPEGPAALEEILGQLEGYEAPAAAWESHILPGRIKDYDYLWLDVLCLSGKIQWGRFRKFSKNNNTPSKGGAPIKTTPISLVSRHNAPLWKELHQHEDDETVLSEKGRVIRELLEKNGATFFEDLVGQSGFLKVEVEEALSQLVSEGLVTSDSFTGLRALLVPLQVSIGPLVIVEK